MLIKALAAAAGNFGGGYSIENSLRFNDNDSAYLSRTPSVTGNRKTWTFSAWVKRGNLSTAQFNTLICSDSGADPDRFYFGRSSTNPDKLILALADTYSLITTQVFRDASGWYHIAVVVDTTQATSSDRVKLYVNGEQITTFSTASYPPLNYDTQFNWTSRSNFIGARTGGSDDFDGYMAEVNFIDGQALTADDFGQIDETTGEWSPIAYSGTYGTNGFYLPFDGNANDSSGNSNNWTENNLASTDFMIDTPTNNFATLNPLAGSTLPTYSDGNLFVTAGGGGLIQSSYSTIGASSGKYYAEFTLTERTNNGLFIGVGTHVYPRDASNQNGTDTGITRLNTDNFDPNFRNITVDGVEVEDGFSFVNGDIVGVALNADDGEAQFYKNGSVLGSLGPYSITDVGTGVYYFIVFNRTNTNASKIRCNFGQSTFAHTPPAGYLALCTDNLPAPAIEQPETQFNVVTYTGTGTTNAVSGVGFQPDFVWLKERNNTAAHFVYDSVRGATLGIHTNLTDAEATYTDGLTSFDTDGFTVGSRSNNNGLGDTYVAWCWKAGGTAVTNTDGTITSQVSANVDAGFSIVSYTGNSTSGATIGHGLNSAPEVVIAKGRAIANSWHVYTKSTGAANVLLLDSTAALYTSNSVWWNNTDPNSTVVTLGSGSGTNSSSAMIAYCFHSVEGFSKFGSYVGNGSADGPFVYTGFRPAFVMMKRTDSTSDWTLLDTSRSAYNVVSNRLWANLSAAEGTAGFPLDIVSNGFKLRASDAYANASGGTYIYMAFAESPTKFSLGR